MGTPSSWRRSIRALRLARALAEPSRSVRDCSTQCSRLFPSRNGDTLGVDDCAHGASAVPSNGSSIRVLQRFSGSLLSRLVASRCCGDCDCDGRRLQGVFGVDHLARARSVGRVGAIRVWEEAGLRGFRSSAILSAKAKVGPSGTVSGHRYKGKRPHDKGGESKAAAIPAQQQQQQEKEDVVVSIFDGMPVDELAARFGAACVGGQNSVDGNWRAWVASSCDCGCSGVSGVGAWHEREESAEA